MLYLLTSDTRATRMCITFDHPTGSGGCLLLGGGLLRGGEALLVGYWLLGSACRLGRLKLRLKLHHAAVRAEVAH